jgi:catechol 2,3-dioxygenase-like lactoylglutathione lyase family enzyme
MRIRELVLQTHRPGELATFYGQVLGLPVQREPDRLSVSCGISLLTFLPVDAAAYYHFAFNIPPGQIEEALRWLQERELEILHEGARLITEFPNWKAQSVYFRDPAGNVLEFIARRELGLSPLQPFAPLTAVRSISEIGLPVRDVPAAARQLEQAGIPPYWGSSSTFRALGNPEGLLIVVDASDKTWYPTTVPARPFPAEVRGDAHRIELRQGALFMASG